MFLIIKTQCFNFLPVGKLHTGFWNVYSRVKKKFKEQIGILKDPLVNLKLFICRNSFGSALELINAVKLKSFNPMFYTYGMSRIFTCDAVMQLWENTHYRHVNENDPIPAVLAEANLDNDLHKLGGWFGGTLGFFWSVG